MEDERQYLNVLKGLLIVFVVIGHFGQTIANNLPANIAFIGQGLVLFIYLFHMPLFLYVSGVLSQNVEKRREKAFCDLFVPYLLFQVLVGIVILVLTKSGGVLQNIFVPYLGAWYLLTLFIYRLILPEVRKVRGVLVMGVLITIITCLMTGLGNEFALKKTLGFFVYFIAGYFIGIPNKKMPLAISRIILVLLIVVIIFISWNTDWYDIALLVLTRNANANDFSSWYIAVVAYSIAFIGTTAVCYLVISAIPEKCVWLEKQGQDTMPMYLSHLILFMAIGYLVNKNNWVVTVCISILGICISIIVFSQKWYRSIFKRVIDRINKVFFKVD